jgi:hypothetical protein
MLYRTKWQYDYRIRNQKRCGKKRSCRRYCLGKRYAWMDCGIPQRTCQEIRSPGRGIRLWDLAYETCGRTIGQALPYYNDFIRGRQKELGIPVSLGKTSSYFSVGCQQTPSFPQGIDLVPGHESCTGEVYYRSLHQLGFLFCYVWLTSDESFKRCESIRNVKIF